MKLTIFGITDGSNATGDFPMESEWWSNKPTEIKIEKGLALNIEAVQLGGVATKVYVKFSFDNQSTWRNAALINLASAGDISVEYKNLAIHPHENDKVFLRLSWDQSTAGIAVVTLFADVKPL